MSEAIHKGNSDVVRSRGAWGSARGRCRREGKGEAGPNPPQECAGSRGPPRKGPTGGRGGGVRGGALWRGRHARGRPSNEPGALYANTRYLRGASTITAGMTA